VRHVPGPLTASLSGNASVMLLHQITGPDWSGLHTPQTRPEGLDSTTYTDTRRQPEETRTLRLRGPSSKTPLRSTFACQFASFVRLIMQSPFQVRGKRPLDLVLSDCSAAAKRQCRSTIEISTARCCSAVPSHVISASGHRKASRRLPILSAVLRLWETPGPVYQNTLPAMRWAQPDRCPAGHVRAALGLHPDSDCCVT
jgi:hypothetical protein